MLLPNVPLDSPEDVRATLLEVSTRFEHHDGEARAASIVSVSREIVERGARRHLVALLALSLRQPSSGAKATDLDFALEVAGQLELRELRPALEALRDELGNGRHDAALHIRSTLFRADWLRRVDRALARLG